MLLFLSPSRVLYYVPLGHTLTTRTRRALKGRHVVSVTVWIGDHLNPTLVVSQPSSQPIYCSVILNPLKRSAGEHTFTPKLPRQDAFALKQVPLGCVIQKRYHPIQQECNHPSLMLETKRQMETEKSREREKQHRL